MRDIFVKNLKKLIKGESTELKDLIEEILIIALVLGAVLLATGIILSVWIPVGLAPLMAMVGALLGFLSLIFMIILWFYQEGLK